jgi:hypothetical protein
MDRTTTNTRTVEDIRANIAALEGELATLAGKPLQIWNREVGDLHDQPPGGATLTCEWANSQYDSAEWFPTTEAAKAALLQLARQKGCVPDEDGFRVDLTHPGCHGSSAYVTRF